MTLNILHLVSLVLGAFSFGLLVAWYIREDRIRGLETVLAIYKKKLLNITMEYGNLEAYVSHLKYEKTALQASLKEDRKNVQKERAIHERSKSKTQSIEGELSVLKGKIIAYEKKIEDISKHISKANKNDITTPKQQTQVAHEASKLIGEYDQNIGFLKSQVNQLKNQLAPQHIGLKNEFISTNRKQENNNRQNIIDRINKRAKEVDLVQIGSAYSKDSLTQLKGLGTFVERKLNAVGIYAFAQIASLNERHEDQLNEIIELPNNKIQQEAWVVQARQLLGLKTEESPNFILQKIAAKRFKLSNSIRGNTSMDDSDDLLLINTLTPFDVAKLNALGIYKFEQISSLQAADIEIINTVLDLPPDRIENEYWVGQANDILQYKDTDSTRDTVLFQASKS